VSSGGGKKKKGEKATCESVEGEREKGAVLSYVFRKSDFPGASPKSSFFDGSRKEKGEHRCRVRKEEEHIYYTKEGKSASASTFRTADGSTKTDRATITSQHVNKAGPIHLIREVKKEGK